MAHVTLVGNLRQFAGGVGELEVDAANIRQLFAKLGAQFPDLAPHLGDGMAVAIDGEIYQETLFQPIGENAVVHLLPAIPGG
ncbi:MAG: MoaD/ThiS family protein [Hyphomicrobiaceae bacterium]|nr:MoaD/ThiS family protein [Hyphomicrobiaceae bacterium]